MPQLHKARLVRVIFVIGCLLAFNSFTLLAQDDTPTDVPTAVPSDTPTDVPTDVPTDIPTDVPTDVPTAVPTDIPTDVPTVVPTDLPTVEAATDTPVPTDETTTDTATVEPVVPSDTATPAPLLAEPPLSLLVRESLDNSDLSPWQANGWVLVPNGDGLALQIENSNQPATLLKGQFFNLAVKAKFLFGSGSAQLSVRRSAVGDYTASIDTNGNVRLTRAGVAIAVGVAPAAGEDGWRTLRLSAINDIVRVAVDDVEVIAIQDSVALPPGDVALSANFPANADGSVSGALEADDFFLWVPQDEFGSYPAPTVIPAVPTVDNSVIVIPPAPTEAPTQPLPTEATEAPTDVVVVTEQPTEEITTEATVEPTQELITEATVEPTELPTEVVTPVEPPVTPPDFGPGKATEEVTGPTAEQRASARTMTNNAIASAALISATYPTNTNGGPDNVDTNLADLEASETGPSGCGFNVGATVWFNFAPSITGNYTFSLAGSGFDTVIGVYTADVPASPTVTTLHQVGCNDDASATVLTSLLTLNGLTAGTHYFIQVGGFQHALGTYTLSVQKVGVPLVAAPVVTTPAASTTIINPNPTLNWNNVVTASGYHLLVGHTAAFASPLVVDQKIAAGTNLLTVASALSPGVYYWKIQSLNSNGVGGSYSAARMFTIKNTTPVQTAPALNAVSITVRPTFTYPSYGTGITYVVELSDTNSFPGDIDQTFNCSTTSCLATASLHQGTWYWQVRAKDIYNTLTAETATGRAFSVNLMKLPADNTVTTSAVPVSVAFTWNATLPTPTLLNTYTLQLDTDGNADFTTGVVTCSPATAAGLTCSIPNLGAGNYDWRVLVTNLDDTSPTVTAGVPHRHFIINPAIPAAPVLSSPAANATTADQTPVLDWADTTTPGGSGGPFTYRVQICTSAACSPASTVVETATPAISTYAVATTLDAGLNGVGKAYYWRVQTINNFGIAGAYSAAFKFTVRTQPPVQALPADGAFVTTGTPSLTWAAYPGLGTTYDLQIDTDPGFGTATDHLGLTATSFVPSPALTSGTYYWHVLAHDGVTSTATSYSLTRRFTVVPVGVTAPAAPVLTSPNTGSYIADLQPNFTWNATTHPNGGPFTYELQYATNSTFTANVVNQPIPTGTNFQVTSDLTEGLYYWHVRTINSFGGAGAYSAARTVNIRHSGPATKTPASGAIVTDTTPPLTWLAYTGSTLYNIVITSDNFCSTIVQTLTSATTTVTPTVPLAQGTYHWCVQARDYLNNADSLTTFGPAGIFTVDIQTLPANNALYTTATTSNVNFMWAAGGTGTLTYTLAYANNSTLTAPTLITGITTLSRIVNLPAGEYWWNVRAVGVDPAQPTAPPIVRHFTISPAAPSAPVLTLPTTLSTIWTTTPTLTWKQSATGSPPVSYDVQLDDLTTFASPEFSTTVLVGACTTTCSIPVSPALIVGKTYNWRVRAKNSLNVYSAYSAVFKFTVAIPPATVTLSLPANGTFTTANMPTFTWVKPVGGFRYEIQLSQDPPASDTVPTPIQAATNSYKPGAPLMNDTYYWRVRAFDVLGTASGWSLPRTVKIVTVAGGAPLANRFGTGNPIDPNGCGTGCAVDYSIPRLTWGPISWTSPNGWYEVTIATNTAFTNPVYQSPHDNTVLPTGTQFLKEGTLGSFTTLANGFYYWRVRACQSNGTCGNWSPYGSFSVDR